MNIVSKARHSRTCFLIFLLSSFSIAQALGDDIGQSVPDTIDIARLTELRDVAIPFPTDPFGQAIFIAPNSDVIVYQLRQASIDGNSYTNAWHASSIRNPDKSWHVGDAGEQRLHVHPDGVVSGRLVITSKAKWSPDGDWIAYLVKQNDEVQLWRSQISGGNAKQLTAHSSNIIDFDWSPDGRQIYFRAYAKSRTKAAEELQEEARNGFIVDERFFPVISREPLRQPSIDFEHWTLEVSTGATAPILPSEQAEFDNQSYRKAVERRFETYSIPKDVRYFDIGDHWFAWAEPAATNDRFAFEPLQLKFASEELQISEAGSCGQQLCRGDIRGVWSQYSDEIFFERREGSDNSEQVFYAWSPSADSIREVLRTTNQIGNCEQVADELICTYASPIETTRVVAIDTSAGTIRTIFDPNPGILDMRFADVERLEWPNAFGYSAFSYLVKPLDYDKRKKYPLAIVPHVASGFLRGGSGDEVPIHVLASMGFVVLAFDKPNSLSRTLGAVSRHLNDYQDYRSMLSSLELAIEQLDSRGLIDTNRMAISGLSDGVGFMYFALMRSEYRFAAATACTSTWEPISYYLVSDVRRKAGVQRSGGMHLTETGRLAGWFYSGLSPSVNAEKIDTPVLLNMPDSEILAAMQTIVTFKELGKAIDAFVYPNEWHIKWQPAHRYSVYRRNLQWFQFWLQGVEADHPVDPEQYVRWRKLREQHIANFEAQGKEYVLPRVSTSEGIESEKSTIH